jgi:phosphoribosylanthranilate isomerase
LCGAKLSDNSLLRPSIGSNQEVHSTQGAVQPPTATFLLTSECTAQEIAQQVALAGASAVQIVSYPSLREYEKLLTLLPMTQRAQVAHVEDESALDMIEQYVPYVDISLLDSGRPSLSTPEFGGTGRTHNWLISAEFVRRSPHPVFLAGGLSLDNVAEAMSVVRPAWVDSKL